MATIRKRKSGTYEIKVSCGYDINGKQIIQYKHWKPDDGMTKKQIEKEVNRQAVSSRRSVRKAKSLRQSSFRTSLNSGFRSTQALISARPPTKE